MTLTVPPVRWPAHPEEGRMSDLTRAEKITAAADRTVAGWMCTDRAALTETLSSAAVTPIHPMHSGGFVVDVGDAVPVWRADMGGVRRLLTDRDRLRAARPAST
jgi:hypothetical protein